MKAKYYTYRNLNRGKSFSTKVHGLVEYRFVNALIQNVTFKVSEAGNARANESGKRNVHAFAVSEHPPVIVENDKMMRGLHKQIKYNPFKAKYFSVDGVEITKAKLVACYDGKLYLLEA